jgi:hypothetical protein
MCQDMPTMQDFAPCCSLTIILIFGLIVNGKFVLVGLFPEVNVEIKIK